MPVKKYTNNLINEKSPYLLQHAHNPVDWYPWGEEAFSRAKAMDKPIFLSIGYSTCHWCHVMERESFEDEEVADILNRLFVCIKVDKEERPDIDAVYMAVCQTMTGQGGWPLTILMTPDQQPFFAGTYLPKQPRYGMPGLIPLLQTASQKWQKEREALTGAGENICGYLQEIEHRESPREGKITDELIRRAVSYFKKTFDSKNGGFGASPKFPTPHNLFFLLRVFQAEKDEALLQMVEKSLCQMARGGIFDHIGGGFCRYSTDSRWLAPHFEKMLYDNALISMAYVEAYQTTKNPFYFHVAQQTLEYVLREMTDPQGGFFSAQDADSEGKEGRYYLFDKKEIIDILGPEHGETFCRHLDISSQGNFEGSNIPNRLQDDRYNEPLPTVWLEKLSDYRRKRAELKTDDKILTAWNGLMIAAMAKAYAALDDDRYLTAARRAMSFILNQMAVGDGLAVWYRDGKSGGSGTIDDYAFTIWALLELYDVTFEPVWLEHAIRLSKCQRQELYDEKSSGFYLYGNRSEQLFLRPKEIYDGAMPSGNSVSAVNLLRLAGLTGDSYLQEWAAQQLKFIAGQIEDMPAGYSFSMLAVLRELYPEQTVISVLPDESMQHRLLQSIRTSFLPRLTMLVKTPQNASALEEVVPVTKEYEIKNNRPTFYLCQNHACSAPFVGIEEWERRAESLRTC